MKYPITMLTIDHPCFGVDVWDVQDNVEYEIAKKQGYLELTYVQNAVKFYQEWMDELYKTGKG